jgi:hypothetical protein
MIPLGLHKKPFEIRLASQVIGALKSISNKVQSRKNGSTLNARSDGKP